MSLALDISRVLHDLPARRVAVIGDLGVDRVFIVDPALRDRSVETGLPIRQVEAATSAPGGAGTIIANLVALGVGTVRPVSILGDDPEGAWLREWMIQPQIDPRFVLREPERPTPAWIRPLQVGAGGGRREGRRLDLFARRPLSAQADARWCALIDAALDDVDAVVVSDYEEAGKVGVWSDAARASAVRRAALRPGCPWLADSRLRPHAFEGMHVAPNRRELAALVDGSLGPRAGLARIGRTASQVARARDRAVFVKLGARGLTVAEPRSWTHWPAWPITAPVDPVGTGGAVAFDAAYVGVWVVR